MADIVTLDERKCSTKREPCMLFSAIPKMMPLSGKEHGDIIMISYLNLQNAALTLRVYRRNHGLRRSPCTIKAVRNLIHKFKELGCTCDRPWSGRSFVPEETVAEVYQTISTVHPASVRHVSHVLHLPISSIRNILRSVVNMFPFRLQRVQMLEEGDNQLRLGFANKFPIRYDEDSSWPLRILWTDDEHFMLTGNMNSKNCVHWATVIHRMCLQVHYTMKK